MDRVVCIIVVLAILLVHCVDVFAEDSVVRMHYLPTAEEIQVLPEYCKIKMKYFQKDTHGPDMQRLVDVLGWNDYQHMQHYCWGLNWMNRYERVEDDYRKNFCLRSAVGEFDYEIKYATKSYILLPEVLLNRARALKLLKEDGAAIDSAKASVVAKPTYVEAYLFLANLMSENEQTGDAMDVLRLGMKKVPDAKLLEDKLKELQNTGKR